MITQFFHSIAADLKENLTTYIFYIFYSVYIIFGTFIMISLYKVAPDFMIENIYVLCGIFATNLLLHTVFFMFYGEGPKPAVQHRERDEMIRKKGRAMYRSSLNTISEARQK